MKRLEKLQPQKMEASQTAKVLGGAKLTTAYSTQDENGFRWEVKVMDRKNGDTKTIIKNVGSIWAE